MTKDQFFMKCTLVGLTGSTFDFGSRIMWVPEKRWIIRFMYDTTGCQLLPEDLENGFNDYIDYRIDKFTDVGDNLFEEFEGGIHIFNNLENCDVREQTWQTLVDIFDGNVPDAMWLKGDL